MSSEQLSLHRNPPFRAEHLGSLLRPDELLQVRASLDQGKASEAELKKVEDKAIDQIVEEQKKIGLRAITDGEYRRHSKPIIPFLSPPSPPTYPIPRSTD
jgi:hypothetical protein